jgi:hypothetical protein
MAVHQTVGKITAITIIIATQGTDVAGTGIHKGMLRQQNADGKTVDMVLQEVVMMKMMTEDIAAHPEIVITIMIRTTEDLETDAAMDALREAIHTATMKTVAQVIHVAAITTMMMTIEVMVMADGLEILKDIQKLLNEDGKTEVVTVTAAITMGVTVAVVTVAVTAEIMMIIIATAKVAAGTAIQKGMLKQLTKVGEIADIKMNCKKNRPNSGRFFMLIDSNN